MISCEDPVNDQYISNLSFYSNTIINCYDIEEGRKSLTFFSEFRNNDIKYNNILFENTNHNTRAFQIRDHKGCNIIGNTVKNANYEEGSAFIFFKIWLFTKSIKYFRLYFY